MTSPLIDENALVRRIEDIERQLRELGPSIAASFNSTVAALVETRSLQTNVFGFSMPSGASASVCSGTITIPDGYTRVSVMAVGEVSGNNNSGGVGFLYGRIFVNGDDSGLHVSSTTGLSEQATITLSRSSYLTGLTPGGVVTVDLYAKGDFSSWGSTSTGAYLSAVALFLR
jgi:hypothetical protein